MDSASTITFGDVAENHVRMQQLGQLAQSGLSLQELIETKHRFEKKFPGCNVELICLNDNLPAGTKGEEAHVLIIRDGVNLMLEEYGCNAEDLFMEHDSLDQDKQALMYKRVVNKKARYNLCFAEENQEPDYASGLGRVISFNDDLIHITNFIRQQLPNYFGKKTKNLMAEGNYYYDVIKCGIGYHGDAERRIVIAIRIGIPIPLQYQWFHKGEPIGAPLRLHLNHGDMYAMSEKATGFDWKKKTIPTLRHAAGAESYFKIKPKKEK